MGRKGRERFEKRQREQARRDRALAKAARKQEGGEATEEEEEAHDEQALLEAFRLLSERHDAGEITDDELAERKRDIFERLGISPD